VTATHRLRNSALAVLAAGVALGAGACGSGQISQTANQVAAVDGGSARTQDLSVSNVHVVKPDAEGAEAKLAFTVAYYGTGLDDKGVTLESVQVDGKPVQVRAAEPVKRGCSLVASPSKSVPTAPAEGVCINYTEATLPGQGLEYGHSVPAVFTFSNGEKLTPTAGVSTEFDTAGEYSRPAEEPAAESHEGH